MSELLRRAVRMIRSYAASGLDISLDEEPPVEEQTARKRTSKQRQDAPTGKTKNTSSPGMPQQVVEDLGVFDLTPPSSWEEVRAARNREVKRYHSDKFVNDPDRFETSKQIMQMYNAAFERLRAYYQKADKRRAGEP